jgi:hypothetical protein
LFTFIANKQIGRIKAYELSEILRKIESRGAVDAAHRCLRYAGQIFRYAISTGRISNDITAALQGALKPAVLSHLSSLKDPQKIGELLRAIDSYTGNPIVTLALKLVLHCCRMADCSAFFILIYNRRAIIDRRRRFHEPGYPIRGQH